MFFFTFIYVFEKISRHKLCSVLKYGMNIQNTLSGDAVSVYMSMKQSMLPEMIVRLENELNVRFLTKIKVKIYQSNCNSTIKVFCFYFSRKTIKLTSKKKFVDLLK